MHGEQLLRLVLQHMSGPKRPVDARARVLELRRQPAVDYVNAAQDRIAVFSIRCHQMMVTPGKWNSNSLARVAFPMIS